MSDGPIRVAYLVSHPIQYQAPMLRALSSLPDVHLHVFFESDHSLTAHEDPGFQTRVEWDVPLTDGYEYSVLRPSAAHGPAPFDQPKLRDVYDPSRFDVLWVHGYTSPRAVWCIENALGRGMGVLVRNDMHIRGNARAAWREATKRTFIKRWSAANTAFLAIGSLNAEYYRQLGAAPRSIVTMPYAVDNAFFSVRADEARRSRGKLREKAGIPADAAVVLFASKLQKRKRTLDLVHAFKSASSRLQARGRSPVLVIAGSGEEEKEVRGACESLNARLVGFRNQHEMAELFGISDVFVLPSSREPWGLVVNEAMSAGLPVIVTDEVGCWPDLVRPGENGYVYPVGDIQALSDALVDVLGTEARTRQMGDLSRQLVERFSIESNLAPFQEALSRVSSSGARRLP